MPPKVPIETGRLRTALIELLILESRAIEDASGSLAGERDIQSLKAHHVRGRAVGNLLDEIGWLPPGDLTPPYELDIATHGWAAIAALKHLVVRERFDGEVAALPDADAEAAGEAGAHRLNDGMVRSSAETRAGIVHKILDCGSVTAFESMLLDYEVEQAWHVCVIAAGKGCDQVLGRIKARLKGGMLVVSLADGTRLAWLCTADRARLDGLADGLEADPLVRLCISDSRHRMSGFHQAYSEAERAWPVACQAAQTVTRAGDVTLLAALHGNAVLARLHRERYLNPLETLPFGGQQALETLEAYIACRGQFVSTANRLSLHRNTVENRIKAIYEVLGLEMHSCLPEIALALRLNALTPTTQPRFATEADKLTWGDCATC